MYWTSMLPFKTSVSLSGSVRLLLIHSSTCTILAVPTLVNTLDSAHRHHLHAPTRTLRALSLHTRTNLTKLHTHTPHTSTTRT